MGVVTTAIKQLPSRHRRNVQCQLREYKPVLSEGEHYANMLNTEELIDITLVNSFKLSILNNRGVLVAEDIATFTTYDEDGFGLGRIAWDIAVFPVLKPGKVRIIIYEEVQNKLSFASNLHEVINDSKTLQDKTAYFKYRHTTNIYRFGYESDPELFIRARLHINALEQSETFDVIEYEEVSTGLSQNPRFDVDLAIEIETENYDMEAHKAFGTFLAHKSKEINNLIYVLQNGSKYVKEGDINSYLKNGKVTLLQQDFSTINKQ
jgi:hypothetical protein